MKFGGKVTGASEIIARLTRASKIVQESSARQIKALALETLIGSQFRAPEETGHLVDSHRMSIQKSGRYIISIWVSVGPVYDEKGEEYSLPMHEGFANLKNPDDFPYKLGHDSEAKNTGVDHFGEGVGYKFLERSFRHVYRNALRRVNDKVSTDLKTGLSRQ